jgi:hypothetical protein
MTAHPLVEGLGNFGFTGREPGFAEDVPQEIDQAGIRLVVSFAETLFGDEKIGTGKQARDSGNFLVGEISALAELFQ